MGFEEFAKALDQKLTERTLAVAESFIANPNPVLGVRFDGGQRFDLRTTGYQFTKLISSEADYKLSMRADLPMTRTTRVYYLETIASGFVTQLNIVETAD
jgi:hypothetical protein